MKRALWLIPAAAGLVWYISGSDTPLATIPKGLTSQLSAVLAKPPCTLPVNPAVAAPTDCIPPHLSHLPPDPGAAGKLTLDGIDSDKDGMRDDVQRWIAIEYPDSEIARKALTGLAQMWQDQVHYGESLGKEETRKRFGDKIERQILCYGKLETVSMQERQAFKELQLVVLNTPERWKQSSEFDYMFAHGLSWKPNITVKEACGFDPAPLIAKAGEPTVSALNAAELAKDEEGGGT